MTEQPIRPRTQRKGPRMSSRTTATRPSDRVSVLLFSLAAFLAVLALLAGELRAPARHAQASREIVVRRIYQTTVVDSAAAPSGATSISQSVSRSASAPAPAAGTRAS